MARRPKGAAGRRGVPPAVLGPPSSEDEADEAPEEVSFGVAKEAAETERKLVGEAARRYRHSRASRHLFPPPSFPQRESVLTAPLASLQAPGAAEGEAAAAPGAVCGAEGKRRGGGAVKQKQAQVQRQRQAKKLVKKDKKRKGTRSTGNYTAVCLKDQSLTDLQQQLAKDFINAQLYGPHANRAQPNDFFSLENKKNPVKKAAVQFVDKAWGQEKKQKAARFRSRWLSTQLKM
uniref:Nucleolar protein 7 n=1 Tax=Amazona collaria TaxID=241587 RepID=A0A8B9ISR7_9PSIT